MNTADLETVDIEVLLTDAGIEFTVVDRCPHPACDVCADRDVPAAA